MRHGDPKVTDIKIEILSVEWGRWNTTSKSYDIIVQTKWSAAFHATVDDDMVSGRVEATDRFPLSRKDDPEFFKALGF